MAFTLSLGAELPEFDLPGTDGSQHTPARYADTGVLIILFTCNHCPYVVGSHDRINAFYDEYKPKGVEMVAINSNAVEHYADDSFEGMVRTVKEIGIHYPYVQDESQAVAMTFGALRTPHYFVFDKDRKLRYTGRMDDNPRNPGKETTRELRDAVDDLLAGRDVRVPLTNPIGCNVKWKGQDKHWMPAEACDLV